MLDSGFEDGPDRETAQSPSKKSPSFLLLKFTTGAFSDTRIYCQALQKAKAVKGK
jgi:hypothetical protein